jgi:hypothetical protein
MRFHGKNGTASGPDTLIPDLLAAPVVSGPPGHRYGGSRGVKMVTMIEEQKAAQE